MTNQELEELLHIIKDIPDGENRNRQTYLILKAAAETYSIALSQFKNHLAPYFGSEQLKKITPKKFQELLDGLEEKGKGKTGDDLYCLLNMIFKAAL